MILVIDVSFICLVIKDLVQNYGISNAGVCKIT